LRGVTEAGIRAALRHCFQGHRRDARGTLDRQCDPHILAVGFDRAEVIVVLHLAGRPLRRAQGGAVDLELELVAIHVVAVGDLPARFQRIGVQGTCRELERRFGVKKIFGVGHWKMPKRTPKCK